MIRFSCDCGHALQVGESAVDDEIRCPRCHAALTVPQLPADQPDRSTRQCPECDSTNVKRITSRRQLKRRVPDGDPLAGNQNELNQAFVFRLPYGCDECGAVWMPPIPRLAGYVIMIGGALIEAFFLGLPIYLYFFVPARRDNEVVYVSGAIIVGGIAAIAYGWHVARGGPHRARVLRRSDEEENDD